MTLQTLSNVSDLMINFDSYFKYLPLPKVILHND
ncbi:hypothetical protein C8C88_2578 [Flavobacterium sp. 123]|nr:hypothetical protein C8C88_2578 [Flavobacterium sp. 123]